MTHPITLIDTGQSNIRSVYNMLKRIGVTAHIASTPKELRDSSRIILPGVGNFGTVMNWLSERGYCAALDEAVMGRGVPILGICLGMQLMANESEEAPGVEGFGWIDGKVREFHLPDRPVPHMGWNDVAFRSDSPFAALYDETPRFYFVHSYYAVCSDDKDVLGISEYGHSFVSAFQRDHVYGMQFHPEKRHVFGMKALTYFAEAQHG